MRRHFTIAILLAAGALNVALRETAENAGRGDSALFTALKTLFRLNEEGHSARPESDASEGDDK